MTRADSRGGDPAFGRIALGLRIVFVVVIGYGALARNIGLVVNGIVTLPIVFLPRILQWRYNYSVDPRLSVWITLAAVVHLLGFFGPYDARVGIWSWYDHVAHAISASFVAGVGYTIMVVLDRNSTRIHFPDEFRFVFTLCFILAFGVAWEIVEFAAGGLASITAVDAGLVQYGKSDIVLDLVFNTLAAALVIILRAEYIKDLFSGFFDGFLGPESP